MGVVQHFIRPSSSKVHSLVGLPLARIPSGLANILARALHRRANVRDAVTERLARLARHTGHCLAQPAGGSADNTAYCVGNAREGIAEDYSKGELRVSIRKDEKGR